MSNSLARHTYRLVLSDDGRGPAKTIEFESQGAEHALRLAHRHCRGREVELLEDDQSLGTVKCNNVGGFWQLSAAPRTGRKPGP